MHSLLRQPPASTVPLAKPDPEILARWEGGPSWGGGSWRDFFAAFSASVAISQPGLTVTQLSECATEKANSEILATSKDKVQALMLLKSHQYVSNVLEEFTSEDGRPMYKLSKVVTALPDL